MKRDMNFVREILVWAESQEHGFVNDNPQIERYSKEEISYHIYILNEAGLVVAHDTTSMGGKSPEALVLRLTWDGYEFLGAAKNDTIWIQARNTIFETTTSITCDLLSEWLKAEARKKLGLS